VTFLIIKQGGRLIAALATQTKIISKAAFQLVRAPFAQMAARLRPANNPANNPASHPVVAKTLKAIKRWVSAAHPA